MRLEAIDTGLRHVTFLELAEIGDWRFKIYGMSPGPESLDVRLIEEARELIGRTVPTRALTDSRLGVGFATVHAGEAGNYVLVDWWERDLLQHHLFGAPKEQRQLEYGWPPGVSCCIWEMAVAWFERNAWYRHVLSREDRPDLDAYLADRLEGTV